MTSRILATFTAITMPGMAYAHPGHIAQAAGHSHWIAAAVIAALLVAFSGCALLRLLGSALRRGRA